jgi:hypothetical protein
MTFAPPASASAGLSYCSAVWKLYGGPHSLPRGCRPPARPLARPLTAGPPPLTLTGGDDQVEADRLRSGLRVHRRTGDE